MVNTIGMVRVTCNKGMSPALPVMRVTSSRRTGQSGSRCGSPGRAAHRARSNPAQPRRPAPLFSPAAFGQHMPRIGHRMRG